MQRRLMEGFQELEWCNSTESLEDLLKNPKVKLPQIIKLTSELKFSESKISLKNGQILNILAKQTTSYINGTDSSGKDISLPLSCPFPVKLTVPQNEAKLFNSLMDIVNTDPLPKFVEVTQVDSLQQECVAGEILKVVLVEKSGNIASFVHFRKSSGTHFKIDTSQKMEFQLASNYPSDILLYNLFEKSRELPTYVQFSQQKNTPKSYLELGTVTLRDDSVSTFDFVIAATEITATEYVVIYPLNLDIKFETNTKLKLANDKGYRDLCCSFSKVMVDDVCNYLDQMIGFKQNGNNFIIKNKKLQKQVQSKADCKIPANGRNEIQGTTDKNSKSNSKHTENGSSKIVKQKSNESIKVKKDKKEKKEKGKEEKKKKNAKVNQEIANENLYLMPQSTTLSTDTSEPAASDKQWTSLLKKGVKKVYRSVSIGQKTKGGKSNELDSLNGSTEHLDQFENSHFSSNGKGYTVENLYCELTYESLDDINQAHASLTTNDSGFDETDQMKINAWRQSMNPPPLPGNHPHQAKINTNIIKEDIYLDAVDCEKHGDLSSVKKDDIVQNSLEEISTWGMEDVGKCLKNLGLQKYKKLFEDSLVDGKLLRDLDESVLIDLGLNLFEASKLRKYVFGWRPGNMRPKKYPILKGFSSEDPLDWNIEDTALHMSGIDIPEMADFCTKNQVDGELLKDICVDEAIMKLIISCQDKKLKILKIRNYVIDGWRPKKKSELVCRNISPIKENVPLNTNSSAEEKKIHIDAPRIARVKQQLEKKANNWEARKKTYH